jgi:hypothetical protein
MARHEPLRHDARGAVYVEFLIAFLPMLVMFLCLWQISILYYVKLMVDHAAITAARSGAVLVAESSKKVNDSGGASTVNKVTSDRTDLIKNAIDISLAPLIISGTISSIKVEYPKPTDRGGADAMRGKDYPPMQKNTVSMFRVRVTASMMCRIAFANRIMCGGPLAQLGVAIPGVMPTAPVVSEAIFPYQGAEYTYDPND